MEYRQRLEVYLGQKSYEIAFLTIFTSYSFKLKFLTKHSYNF